MRVLEVAHDLLAEGGLAIVQIRYVTDWKSKSKRFSYQRNFVTMTAYSLDNFWYDAEEKGFVSKAITLVPKQPLVDDGHYAYFILQKNTRDASLLPSSRSHR